MHRALYVAEIAEEIAKACLIGNYDLESNLQDVEGRAALFALAQTCHALSEPALDALWSFQHGLPNLIRTMPSDLWQDEETEHSTVDCNAETQQWSTTQLHFIRRPETLDWMRFDYYAKRIRVFEYDEALCWVDVASNVYDAISARLTSLSSSLFPAAVSLRWEADIFFPYISLFLSPSIRTLTISTVQAEERLVDMLASLPAKCRYLKKLEVYSGTSSTMPPPSLSCWSEFQDVRGFADLHHSSDPMDWLPPLAALPDLLDLSLSISNSTMHSTSLKTTIPFPSLSRLALFTDNIPQCVRILSSCQFDALRDLTLNAYDGVTDTIRDFSLAMSQSIPSSSLRSFSVFDYSSRVANEAVSVDLSSLTGLLQFSNMRRIRLDVRYTIHVADASLCALSRGYWGHYLHSED
ncbi:hypothetical protein EIP86_002564 [Pleurotus ostreatoroseus]|nr:hypothetical protein EIP86_002564 [Pleurotus ostreatoroseus]